MKPLPILLALALSTAALAEGYAPPPPRLPAPQHSGEEIEPEVTISEDTRGTVYEYRQNGILYMVKIQPKRGKPYYEIDTNGDGKLDTRTDDPRNASVTQWVISTF